jgi:hypothetical protein
MNTKRIPAIVMLLAGAVTCIVTYIDGYDIRDTLFILFWVLIIFLVLGIVVKRILDSFRLPDENAVDDSGEMIEKQSGDGVELNENNGNEDEANG